MATTVDAKSPSEMQEEAQALKLEIEVRKLEVNANLKRMLAVNDDDEVGVISPDLDKALASAADALRAKDSSHRKIIADVEKGIGSMRQLRWITAVGSILAAFSLIFAPHIESAPSELIFYFVVVLMAVNFAVFFVLEFESEKEKLKCLNTSFPNLKSVFTFSSREFIQRYDDSGRKIDTLDRNYAALISAGSKGFAVSWDDYRGPIDAYLSTKPKPRFFSDNLHYIRYEKVLTVTTDLNRNMIILEMVTLMGSSFGKPIAIFNPVMQTDDGTIMDIQAIADWMAERIRQERILAA